MASEVNEKIIPAEQRYFIRRKQDTVMQHLGCDMQWLHAGRKKASRGRQLALVKENPND